MTQNIKSFILTRVHIDGVMMITCDSEFFDDLGDLDYGEYDYTDRNPKHSNENAWFWRKISGGGQIFD